VFFATHLKKIFGLHIKHIEYPYSNGSKWYITTMVNHHQTTIWENILGTFSKHRTSKSKASASYVFCFHFYVCGVSAQGAKFGKVPQYLSSERRSNSSGLVVSLRESCPKTKNVRRIHMGVSLNGGTLKTPQNDHFL